MNTDIDRSTSNLGDADGFYEDLLAAHQGLSDADSALLDSQLLLLLANQVGDPAVLRACLAAARSALRQHHL